MNQAQLAALVRAEGGKWVRIEIVARPDGYVLRYVMPTGRGALLTVRGGERVFGHIETCLGLLRRMGITSARLIFENWRPRKGLPGYLADNQEN